MDQPENPLAMLVRKLELHATLSDNDRGVILGLPYRLKTYEPATYLVREGDEPVHCAVLISGYAYRQKTTGDGSRQILSLHIPGEALDFQHLYLEVADHSVQMLTRGEVALVARKDLQAMAGAHPIVARAIVTAMLVEASIFREWVLNVGRRDARGRMAHFLCEFALRMQAQGLTDGQGYELPITQELLADALGLTPVHISRTLKSLEAGGFIKRNKRIISFPSWERLREVGDFNQRYLHLQQDGGVWPEGAVVAS